MAVEDLGHPVPVRQQETQPENLMNHNAGWHCIPSDQSDAVGVEFCCSACVSCIEVRRITPLLTQLHWLKVPKRIEFKLAVLVYRCLHQTAPPYLAEEFHQSSTDDARHFLRSASTSSLVVRRTRLSTIGDRAFPVAAARLWNTLPPNVRSASSLSDFSKHLKNHLFSHFLPNLL